MKLPKDAFARYCVVGVSVIGALAGVGGCARSSPPLRQDLPRLFWEDRSVHRPAEYRIWFVGMSPSVADRYMDLAVQEYISAEAIQATKYREPGWQPMCAFGETAVTDRTLFGIAMARAEVLRWGKHIEQTVNMLNDSDRNVRFVAHAALLLAYQIDVEFCPEVDPEFDQYGSHWVTMRTGWRRLIELGIQPVPPTRAVDLEPLVQPVRSGAVNGGGSGGESGGV